MHVDNYEVLNEASQQEDNFILKKIHKDWMMLTLPNARDCSIAIFIPCFTKTCVEGELDVLFRWCFSFFGENY
jgi:hypothetical protein